MKNNIQIMKRAKTVRGSLDDLCDDKSLDIMKP
jgi:hypothetical protein